MGNLFTSFPIDLDLAAKHLPELEKIAKELESIPQTYEDLYTRFWQLFLELFTSPPNPIMPDDGFWRFLMNIRNTVGLTEPTTALMRLTHHNERMEMASIALKAILNNQAGAAD